ncbi:MAG: hypothetical protein WC744_02295 [Patescibacteria group bacterium]|jgi:hypothetical protein
MSFPERSPIKLINLIKPTRDAKLNISVEEFNERENILHEEMHKSKMNWIDVKKYLQHHAQAGNFESFYLLLNHQISDIPIPEFIKNPHYKAQLLMISADAYQNAAFKYKQRYLNDHSFEDKNMAIFLYSESIKCRNMVKARKLNRNQS